MSLGPCYELFGTMKFIPFSITTDHSASPLLTLAALDAGRSCTIGAAHPQAAYGLGDQLRASSGAHHYPGRLQPPAWAATQHGPWASAWSARRAPEAGASTMMDSGACAVAVNDARAPSGCMLEKDQRPRVGAQRRE